jgi:hypothetical protein
MKKYFHPLLYIFLVALALLLAGCRASPRDGGEGAGGPDLAGALAGIEQAQGGWQAQAAASRYNRDNLYDLMNGQSDSFFVYGFQEAAVQRFTHPSGAELVASLFRVDTPESAYGLFSGNQDREPLDVGNQGSTSPGQRLSFWQANYFVQMTALQPVPPEDLLAAGQAVAEALPEGGEPPALMARLPAENLAQDPPPVFFHEEISIQDKVWLGGENVLGLGQDTDGVVGAYELDGQTAWLVLIAYPDAQRASAALQAVQAGPPADLLAAQASGAELALVFGQVASPDAGGLAEQALRR